MRFPRAVVDSAHDVFVSLDGEGRVVYWNKRAEQLFGIPREEILRHELAEEIVPERYRARHREGLRRFVEAGDERPPLNRTMHVAALRADGSEFPVEMTLSAVCVERAWLIYAWIRDLSERAVLLRELEAQLRGGGPGFAEILDALAEAVTIRDPHHHIIYANRAALDRMGFASLEEMQRLPPQSILGDYIVRDEVGNEVTMDDIPSVRLLGGEAAQPLVLRTVHRRTGELRWNVLKSTLLHGDSGEAAAAVTIIEDVTREKTAELRDQFLARATETLIRSLDYQQTLRNVAWLAVPEIADWCAVDLIDESGVRDQVVVAHPDRQKLTLAERLRRFDAQQLNPETGIGRVVRSGISELYPDITDEMLVGAAVNDEHLRLLRAVGFRSALLVPLRARGRTLGVMTLVTAESMRRFDESDREFAEQLAGRAAVAVDNARLATSRREVAETLQRSLLPEAVPLIEEWEIATMYRPASASDAIEVEVGGDFYDFFQTNTGWIVLLGDVTGRGVQAAAMTSLVRHGARFLAKREHSPSKILARLHQALREQSALSLCSALCLRLEGKEIVISSAGHPAPLVVRDDGRIRELGVSGPILGAWSESEWVDSGAQVDDDETLFVYTDGVVDARGEDKRFGARRLRRVLAENAARSPAELLAAIEAALDSFQVEGQSDDTAALALRPISAENSSAAAREPALGTTRLRTA
jgi:PAS domain S-box-containing protein